MSIKAKYINFDSSQNYSKYLNLSRPFNLNYYNIGNSGNSNYEYAISSIRKNEESKLSEILHVQNASSIQSLSNFVNLFEYWIHYHMMFVLLVNLYHYMILYFLNII